MFKLWNILKVWGFIINWKNKFGYGDLNGFVFIPQSAYSNKYIDSWGKFTSLSSREECFCNLSMEGITKSDYKHGDKVWNTFNIMDFDDHHDLPK